MFPPHINLSATQHRPVEPWYLASPPAVINIDTGRQLFVDDFLVNRSAGLTTHFYQATVLPEPRLAPTKPWEGHSAKAYSGGVWWDPTSQLYKAHYGCSGCKPCGLCMAISHDALTWTRPALQTDGSNCVLYDTVTHCKIPLTTTTVWLDLDDPDTAHRFKLAEVPHCEPTANPAICPPWNKTELGSGFANGHFRIFGSADGVRWDLLVNYTGITADRATMYKDAFRDRWVFSIKATGDPGKCTSHLITPLFQGPTKTLHVVIAASLDPMEGHLNTSLDRYRMFFQTPTPSLDSFTGDHWGPRDVAPWLSGDALDPPWMGDPHTREEGEPDSTFAGLYNFDGANYESVLVGLYSIYRCKGGPRYGCPTEYTGTDGVHRNITGHGEFDSIFLGFSRDGFAFHRPGEVAIIFGHPDCPCEC